MQRFDFCLCLLVPALKFRESRLLGGKFLKNHVSWAHSQRIISLRSGLAMGRPKIHSVSCSGGRPDRALQSKHGTPNA